MKMRPDDLKSLSNHHFEKQRYMLSLWQTLADHFYPERADFTVTRNVGSELADGLMDSYPVLVRRDLANSFAAMLRDGHWFEMSTDDDIGYQSKVWLQWATQRLRKLMNDRQANLTRATKEGDHDFATFGQLVMSVERNRKWDGILFRTWHMRDCAWFDDENGMVCGVMRKWKPPYHMALQYFGEKKLHANVVKAAEDSKAAWKQADMIHFEIPTELYGDDELQSRFPYVSVWLDIQNNHIVEEVGLKRRTYIVPRFQTISGSPYAYSPATIVALPDARCLQAMTHTLLEAGERYARPPLIGTHQVVRGNVVDLSPDGITWVDKEYDERFGEALRPLTSTPGTFPIGTEMRQNVVNVLSSAFYINKLTLPDPGTDMTAYEVSQRMKQFRRENLPLFAPIEAEYSGQMCEQAMALAMDMGLMGSPYDIPDELRQADINFKFKSPLSDADDAAKATLFQQTAKMLAEASQMDQEVIGNVNFDTAFRDALQGIGAPAKWLNNMDTVLKQRAARAMQQAADKLAQAEQAPAPQVAAAAVQSGNHI